MAFPSEYRKTSEPLPSLCNFRHRKNSPWIPLTSERFSGVLGSEILSCSFELSAKALFQRGSHAFPCRSVTPAWLLCPASEGRKCLFFASCDFFPCFRALVLGWVGLDGGALNKAILWRKEEHGNFCALLDFDRGSTLRSKVLIDPQAPYIVALHLAGIAKCMSCKYPERLLPRA